MSTWVASKELLVEHLTRVLDACSDATVGFDTHGRITSWNHGAQSLFGYLPEEIIGSHVTKLDPPGGEGCSVMLQRACAGQTLARLPVRRRHKDGRILEVELTVVPAFSVSHEPLYFTAVYRDLSYQRGLETRLQATRVDPVTGLPSSQVFIEHLVQALSTGTFPGAGEARGITSNGTKEPSNWVAIFDLDAFGAINDALGDESGDRVLRVLAWRLLNCERLSPSHRLVARLAGDEIGVFFSASGEQEAKDKVARALDVFSMPVEMGQRTLRVHASCGLTEARPGLLPLQVIRQAKSALALAKATGKRHMRMFDPSLHSRSLEELDLADELSQAVERRQIVPWFQPVVELATGRIVGAEALARWIHPIRGTVMPAHFIELAERTGDIIEITFQIFEQSLSMLATWEAHDLVKDFHLSLNLSPVHLRHPFLARDLARTIEHSGADPSLIQVEITESALIDDNELTASALNDMRSLGLRMAIDDFGSGYATIGALDKVQPQLAKLDRSLIHGITENLHRAHLVQATLDMLHATEIDTLAEGVEDRSEGEMLGSMGCQFGQGFYWARPMPVEDFTALLSSPTLPVEHPAPNATSS
jgi:PAS domain S-box-containing protein/diguanylate cyclase (GGDEF)-like protein